jgi:hypothetical protein
MRLLTFELKNAGGGWWKTPIVKAVNQFAVTVVLLPSIIPRKTRRLMSDQAVMERKAGFLTLRSGGILYPLIFIVFHTLGSCDDTQTPSATLDDVSVRSLGGYIEANLMPAVPPDPITCQISLLVENKNPVETLIGLSIPHAEVYLDSANQRLGTINFSTSWDGKIGPGEQDTVRLTKVISQTTLFSPPCTRTVYFNVVVRDQNDNSKTFKAESLLFTCVY